jgi:hypothetical protein
MLLALCSGTGAQLVCTALVVVCIAVLSYMSPAQRGYLLLGFRSIFFLALFAMMGWVLLVPNGYERERCTHWLIQCAAS